MREGIRVFLLLPLFLWSFLMVDACVSGGASAQYVVKKNGTQQNRFKPINRNVGVHRQPSRQVTNHAAAKQHLFKPRTSSGSASKGQPKSFSGSGSMQKSARGSHKSIGQGAWKPPGTAGAGGNGHKSNNKAAANQFKQFNQLQNPAAKKFVPKATVSPVQSPAANAFSSGPAGRAGARKLPAVTKPAAGALAKTGIPVKPVPIVPSAAAQKLEAQRLQRVQALRQAVLHRRSQAGGMAGGTAGSKSPAGLPGPMAKFKSMTGSKGARANAVNVQGNTGAGAGAKGGSTNLAAKFLQKTPAGPWAKGSGGGGSPAAGAASKQSAFKIGSKAANGAYKASPITKRKWYGLANAAKPYLSWRTAFKSYPVSSASNPQLYQHCKSLMWGVKKAWVPYAWGGSAGFLFITIGSSPDTYEFEYQPGGDGGGGGSDEVYYAPEGEDGDGIGPVAMGPGGGVGGGGGSGSGSYPSTSDHSPAPAPAQGSGAGSASSSGGGTAGDVAGAAESSGNAQASAAEAASNEAADGAVPPTSTDAQQEASQQEDGTTPSLATLGGIGGARFDACATPPEKKAASPGTAAHDEDDDQAPASPQLVLDTGGHTAPIRALVFTASGNCLISGGDDKTIRIWNLAEARSERVLRGEIDTGAKGTIHALALSPDGILLAAAGSMDAPALGGQGIRVYDLRTGEIAFVLAGHSDEVRALAFSPDGGQLLSGSMDGVAILWDIAARQPSRVFRGHEGGIIAVGFTSDGQHAVTASLDKTARLWSPDADEASATLSGHGAPLSGMTVLAGSGSIATAAQDGSVKLWSGSDGRAQKDLARLEFVPGAVASDAEGGRLVVTCAERCRRKFEQRVLSIADGSELASYKGHDGFVLPVAIREDGLAATAGGFDHEIHLWKLEDTQTIETLKGTGRTVSATGFYTDNRTIAWSHTFEGTSHLVRGPIEVSIDLPDEGARLGTPLQVDEESAKGFVHSEDRAGEWSVTAVSGSGAGGKGGGTSGPGSGGGGAGAPGAAALEIRENSEVRSLLKPPTGDKGERLAWRTYGFAPSGEVLLGGGDKGLLEAYDLEGGRLAAYVGHAGTVWTQTPSPDGRLLISGGSDQTVKLWNLATGELVVTLFHGTDGEWVMWTPQGYYTGSQSGGELVGWHINRGPDKAADYVRSQQLREHLRRPDIVERAILSVSASEAVEALAPQGMTIEKILQLGRPPVVTALQGEPEASGGRTTIVVGIRESNLPVDSIDVWVKDRKVAAEPGELPADLAREAGTEYRALVIPLFGGDNVVRVVATNEIGSSDQTEAALSIRIKHRGEGALDKRGTLYIVAVGVDRYPGLPKRCLGPEGSCDLQYAGSDARGFSAIAEREMQGSHDRVQVHLLTNLGGEADAPTKANIKAALDRIVGDAKGNDTVALFFAGHGLNRGGGYYFVPTDARESKGEDGTDTFIEWSEVQAAINRVQGRRLLFLDACHASNSYYHGLTEDAKVSRFFAFTAAKAEQFAEEATKVKHGQFTYALINGLGGRALDETARAILLYDLASYVSKEVERATNGRQTPEFFTTPGEGNFALVKR